MGVASTTCIQFTGKLSDPVFVIQLLLFVIILSIILCIIVFLEKEVDELIEEILNPVGATRI